MTALYANPNARKVIRQYADYNRHGSLAQCELTDKTVFSQQNARRAVLGLAMEAGLKLSCYPCDLPHWHLTHKRGKTSVNENAKLLIYRGQEGWHYCCPWHPEQPTTELITDAMPSHRRAIDRALRHLRTQHDVAI